MNDFNKELDLIKRMIINNGYKKSRIDHFLQEKQKKMLLKDFYPIDSQKNNTNKLINYLPLLSNKINK